MKLLIYSNFFLPHPGGTQAIVLELARGFSSWHANHPGADPIQVTVVTQTAEPWTEDAKMPFAVVRAPSFAQLASLIRHADLIHLAGPAVSPLVASVLMRKRFVIEHHSFSVSCPNGQYFYEPGQSLCPGHFMAGHYSECLRCNRTQAGLLTSAVQIPLSGFRRWLCNRANANIIPTTWLGTILKLNRMHAVHHGIPPESQRVVKASSPPVFGFQGRLVTTKGIRVLLDAVNELQKEQRSFSLKILGSGPELDGLKATVARSGANVEFLGHVPDDKLPGVLADVSVVVMPSLAGEVFGLVAAENMLRGKLVMVSDLGSLEEVVSDSGLVFRNGDAVDLAGRMKQVLDDPSIIESLGSRARSRALQEFDLNAMIEKHIQIYRSVLSE
jgi:glycosyltransferase involved in cell wall biosynthesis